MVSGRAKKNQKGRKTFFSIGPVGKSIPMKNTSDFLAIRNGYISITPLSTDMCDNTALIKLKKNHDKI